MTFLFYQKQLELVTVHLLAAPDCENTTILKANPRILPIHSGMLVVQLNSLAYTVLRNSGYSICFSIPSEALSPVRQNIQTITDCSDPIFPG